MKSLFCILTLSAIGIAAVHAQEESRQPFFGVEAAMEITIPDRSHGIYQAASGFKAGGFYNMPLKNSNFFFEPGVQAFYNTLGLNNIIPDNGTDGMYSGSVRNFGIRIPLYLGYSFDLPGRLNLSVATGPQLNINLITRRYLDPNFVAPAPPAVNLFSDGKGWKRVEALWGLKLKLTFAECYSVGIDGGVVISPLASYGNRDNKIKIRRASVAISLGYNFR